MVLVAKLVAGKQTALQPVDQGEDLSIGHIFLQKKTPAGKYANGRLNFFNVSENFDSSQKVLLSQGHNLTDTKFARPDHRAVYAGVIPVPTHNSLHHFRIWLGCVRVKIHHDT